MTLAAVWKAGDRLMSMADTRISRDVGNVLTEHGPKILPIRVRGKKPDASGFFDQGAFQFDIGFAYAGSTLSALSTYALASALLGNLAGPNGEPPSLAEIARFCGGISAEYMREVGQLNGNSARFCAIIFGFCQVSRTFQGFEIQPCTRQSPLTCEVIETTFHDEKSMIIIGSCPGLLRERIDADRRAALDRGDVHPIFEMDRPINALQALINENADPSVGGMIQQGWATPAGFELVATSNPIEPRPPSPRNAGLFVLGFDVLDMRQVGANVVSLIAR